MSWAAVTASYTPGGSKGKQHRRGKKGGGKTRVVAQHASFCNGQCGGKCMRGVSSVGSGGDGYARVPTGALDDKLQPFLHPKPRSLVAVPLEFRSAKHWAELIGHNLLAEFWQVYRESKGRGVTMDGVADAAAAGGTDGGGASYAPGSPSTSIPDLNDLEVPEGHTAAAPGLSAAS